MKKKILILTVTAGNAHNECAKRMKEKLQSLDSEAEIKIIDVLNTYSTAMRAWVADEGYNLVVGKMVWAYHPFYNHYKKAKPENRYTCGAQGSAMSIMRGLLAEVIDFEPDVIYCTHFYGAIALSNLRLVYDLPCKVVMTSLDYVYSPFWEGAINVDYFNIPNEDFIDGALRLGFSHSQLLPFGLPVSEKTLEVVDKLEARKELGIDENLTTICVMFGGGLWKGGFEIFKNLLASLKGHKAQIIMINGKNKKDYDRISKIKFDEGIKVVNVGFTDKVSLYLSASDFIINKCGGASATEMINKALPMIITEKVPTQEIYNYKYLKEKGCAFSFVNKKELKRHVLALLLDKDLREKMSDNCRKIRKDALNDLARFIMTFPKADYSKLHATDIDLKRLNKIVKQKMCEAQKKEHLSLKQAKKMECHA